MSVKQLVTPNLNITYEGGLCERAIENTVGETGIYPTAIAAWAAECAAGTAHVGNPPAGVDVPIYTHLGSQPDGDVAISLTNGKVAAAAKGGENTPLYEYTSLAAYLADYGKYNGGATLLGWGEMIGHVQVVEIVPDPVVPSVKVATVEKALAMVRSQPHVSAPLAGSQQLTQGQTFDYVGLVTGDSVSGNNQWLQSTLGHYVWSGGIAY